MNDTTQQTSGESKTVFQAKNTECAGHFAGRLLFRIDTEKHKKLEFFHEPGSDRVELRNGDILIVSIDTASAIDKKQEEYIRYISAALNSEDGFSKFVYIDEGFDKYDKSERILCFKEVETDEYSGWRSFLECIVIEKCEAITGEAIEYSSYGICEVENVVKYSISTSQESLKLNLFFDEDISADRYSEQLKKYLPEINQNRLYTLPSYVSSILLYALENEKWLMASKILDIYHLLSKSKCKKLQNRKK